MINWPRDADAVRSQRTPDGNLRTACCYPGKKQAGKHWSRQGTTLTLLAISSAFKAGRVSPMRVSRNGARRTRVALSWPAPAIFASWLCTLESAASTVKGDTPFGTRRMQSNVLYGLFALEACRAAVLQRCPDLCPVFENRKQETLRHHPNDMVDFPVHVDIPVKDAGICVECIVPEGIAKKDYMRPGLPLPRPGGSLVRESGEHPEWIGDWWCHRLR